MRMRFKLLPLTVSAALLLTGCAEGAGDAATEVSADASGSDAGGEQAAEEESQTIAMAETGWLTVSEDGAVQTTFFDTGGRYRDFRNGEAMGEGDWEQRPNGELCLEPDEGLGACWETGQTEEDGSAIVTNEDGARVEIKRVTYVPPETDENEDEGDGSA
jgi:hypothetical protein